MLRVQRLVDVAEEMQDVEERFFAERGGRGRGEEERGLVAQGGDDAACCAGARGAGVDEAAVGWGTVDGVCPCC
jgi:hypothetical protein